MPSVAFHLRFLLWALVALGVSGCCATKVKWIEPAIAHPTRSDTEHLRFIRPDGMETGTERLYAEAVKAEKECSAHCVDLYFQVAVETHSHDGPDCSSCRQRLLHKSALVKLVSAGQRFRRLDPERGLKLHSCEGERYIALTRQGFPWQLGDFHGFTPVGKYKAKVLGTHYRCPGLGIPLVAMGCRPSDNGRFLPDESTFNATLRLCLDHEEPRLELYDPWRIKEVTHCGTEKRIARDFSASLAYRLSKVKSSVIPRFINPDGPSRSDGLRVVEPYQKGKIPVVLIHGLLSNPFTWAKMVNELRVTPRFNERFQIWVYQYPTGKSFVASGNDLREQLAQARETFDPSGQDPYLSNIMLIGHSMGGLIAKMQITCSGDRLWGSVANRPIDQVRMPERVRTGIKSEFFFQPSPDVSRVVFISTPHRGSGFATRFVGRIGASLVRREQREETDHRNLMNCNPGVFSDEVTDRIPTSIDLLEPDSKLLNAVANLPVGCRVKMHSVIGDSCGNCLFGKSDGIVPVTSAREPRAITELTVKATHTKSKDHPRTIKEIRTILNLHWQQSAPKDIVQADLQVATLRRTPEVVAHP